MRKEKYISKQEKPSGTYYLVRIKNISKSFAVASYKNERECLKAAIRFRDLTVAQMHMDALDDNPKLTINQCMSSYDDVFNEAFSTRKNMMTLYNKYVKQLEDVPIASISGVDIQKTLNLVADEGNDTYISKCLNLWRKIYKIAYLLGYKGQDKTVLVVKPSTQKASKEKAQEISDDDFYSIIAELMEEKGKNEESIFNNKLTAYALIVMKATGIRPAECFALEKKNIDYINYTIKVGNRVALGGTDGVLEVHKPKTSKSSRTIPLTTQTMQALENACNMTRGSDFVFLNYRNKLFNPSFVQDKLRKIAKRLGIEFNMYMLRHQFSTDLITTGTDARTVMELMGHAKPTMTIEYARSNDDLKRDAIKKLN